MGIDHRDRTAEFGISMGDRRGRGLGTDAARLTLDWGFTVLSLHNVLLRALDWNVPALASYRRAGFRELGRRREAVLSDGRLCDEVYMDALASEFTGSVLAPGAGG
jgi:RimJ/RimL family protein N-acetyltransferase